MKKTILTIAALLMATTAFAATGDFVSGSVYSIGSMNPAAFKPSPSVTIHYYSDVAGPGSATDWSAVSYHKSALGNKKGFAYWTSKSDPGLWYYKDDSAGITAATVEAAAVATSPTEASAGSAGWRPEGK